MTIGLPLEKILTLIFSFFFIIFHNALGLPFGKVSSLSSSPRALASRMIVGK
jgi:hypothetical protein